jgi:hypothetical protein
MKQIAKTEAEVAMMEVKLGTKHIGYLDRYILTTIYRAMAFNLFLLSPCYVFGCFSQLEHNGLQLHAVKNSVGISKGFLIACRCCYVPYYL